MDIIALCVVIYTVCVYCVCACACVCASAGGPAVWCGGGTGSEGGRLAAVRGQAAERGLLFRTGAGAGEGAAQ